MTAKTMKLRVRKAGGHFDITFWTGKVGYTFANIGTLTMDESDMWLLLEVLSHDERVISIDRQDLSCASESEAPPSPSGYGCPDCGTPSDRDSEGSVCSTCHRGIVEDLADDDELDYISGTEPGTWCADDSLKEG